MLGMIEQPCDGGAAEFSAAVRYQTGCDGTPKNLEQALCSYVTAAAVGHVEARKALYQDFASQEHLELAARLPQVHEAAVRELTSSRPSLEQDTCADTQPWQAWLADVERRRFFADDVALGDRNQQIARLCSCITLDTAPPPAALVWLLVDLIDAHDYPALKCTCGPALLQYLVPTTVAPDLHAATCTLLAVLAERESTTEKHRTSLLWAKTAATLVELLDKEFGRDAIELTAVTALDCLAMPCVLLHTDPQTLALILKQSMQYPGRIFERGCRCVISAAATRKPDVACALVNVDLAKELFVAVDTYCPASNDTEREANCCSSGQDILIIAFQALRALISTGALDGRLACVAETLIGNTIRYSLRVPDYQVQHNAFLLLLEAIARPWPAVEIGTIKSVADAVFGVIEMPLGDPDGPRRLIAILATFVSWLPRTDWDMVPVLVAAACKLDDRVHAPACAEWCKIVAPRVKEWTCAQLLSACDCVVARSPGWLACQDHPEANIAVILLWSELLTHACACDEPAGANIINSLIDMLDNCGGVQATLKLAADFEQPAQLVAQLARARHYPGLECRQHSPDASGHYLSLLVQAHIAPRLFYTIAGVRSAFEKSDFSQQALLVDTWTHLNQISETSLHLIIVALEQSAAMIRKDGLTALPFGVLIRLIFLFQHVSTEAEASQKFVEACNRGLKHHGDLSSFLSDIPTGMTDEIMLWMFKHVDKEVLSSLFVEWLSNRDSPGDEVDANTCTSVDTWMTGSTYCVQLALHLLCATTINDSDSLESGLLDFLLSCSERGGTELISEMCTRGIPPLTRIIRDNTQIGVSDKYLRLLRRLLNHCLYCVGGHERRYFSEHLIPVVGAVGSLLSTTLSAVSDDMYKAPMASDTEQTISSCIECLFLVAEGVPTSAAGVVAAMRPDAHGVTESELHLHLFKLLQSASQTDNCNENMLTAVACTISLFISLLYKDDEVDLQLISNLLHSFPPTVGALACAWLGASWQLRREQQSASSALDARTVRTLCVSSAHPELHMQLLNLALAGEMSPTPLIPISAVYCLEELYAPPENNEVQSALMHGWPLHAARVGRGVLMGRVNCSLEHEQMQPTQHRAAATEAAELVAASKLRASETMEMMSLINNAKADGAAARLLGALITRWPSIAPELFEPTDTAVVVRYVAHQDENFRPAFRTLVSAFAEHGLTARSEKQEAVACVQQIDQFTQSLLADEIATVVWIPAVHNGLSVPIGHSCRSLCERTARTVWGSPEPLAST